MSSFDQLGTSFGEGAILNEKVSKGTFILLTESIHGLSPQQRKTVVKEHKKVFGNEFQLIELSSKEFTKKQIKDLNAGKVVSIEESPTAIIGERGNNIDGDDETIIYYKIPESSLVWRTDLAINVNQSIDENGIKLLVKSDKLSEGMFYLIEARLKNKPEESWELIINDLQKHFDFQLRLKAISALQKINNKQLFSINKGHIVNITQGSEIAIFVHRVFDSSIALHLGPIHIPWYMRNFIYFGLLSFMLSFATMLLLWIWPLWSNLIKLKKASVHFGNGEYDTRVSDSFFSPISKVTEAFNAMADRTQRGIHTQKELTSAISHELRTPVARMRFALEMLDESNSKDDKSRYINDINTDIDELDMLLEELLTYARLDHNNSDFEQGKLGPTILSLWFKQTMQKLEPLAGTKNLAYKIQDITEAEQSLIEPRLMSRVLDNLVQNALRYAKQNVKVTLSKENDDFLLIVEDDGKGIPTDKQEHIFDAFSRIDESRDRASGGFGLGLAIADRIIRNHKGSITLHDSPSGGACFIVRVPMRVV